MDYRAITSYWKNFLLIIQKVGEWEGLSLNQLQADKDTMRAKATIFRSTLNQKQGENILY